MTDWQRGYGDAYLPAKIRPYPALPQNDDYMAGFTAGQEDWRDRQRAIVALGLAGGFA